jgi:subtilisin
MISQAPWPSRAEGIAALHDGTGAGVRVAVLDTGVDAAHAVFDDCKFADFWETLSLGPGMRIQPAESGDPAGHGTAIAGIIHRVAPQAEILSIRVLDASSRQRRHEAIRMGAMFALEQNAAILNCSFGVPGTLLTLPEHLAWTDAAFHRSRIVVGASSNDSVDMPEWPSHLAAVIGVTAADCRENELQMHLEHPVSLAAAGVSVEVPVPGGGTGRVSGSSFAAARVSGMLARLMSVFPGLSPGLAREVLHQCASAREPKWNP